MNVLLSVFVGLMASASVVAGLTSGILGDVDDNGYVDIMDYTLVSICSADSSVSIPGDISLGDINADGQIDSTDVRMLTVYLYNPSDPTLPPTIGRPSGDVCSVGLELSPGQSCSVDLSIEGQGYQIKYYRFKVKADKKGYYNYNSFEKTVFGSGMGYGRISSDSSHSANSANSIDMYGFQASRIADTSRWKIEALPEQKASR